MSSKFSLTLTKKTKAYVDNTFLFYITSKFMVAKFDLESLSLCFSKLIPSSLDKTLWIQRKPVLPVFSRISVPGQQLVRSCCLTTLVPPNTTFKLAA
jgi:hypothetical protein